MPQVEFAYLEECPVEPGVYDKVVFSQASSESAAASDADCSPVSTSGDAVLVPAGPEQWWKQLHADFPGEQAALAAYQHDLVTAAKAFMPYLIWRSMPWGVLKRLLYYILAKPMVKLSLVTATERLKSITDNHRLKAALSYLSLGCAGVCSVAALKCNNQMPLGVQGRVPSCPWQ